MFNLLKGKLKSFTEKLRGKAEEKAVLSRKIQVEEAEKPAESNEDLKEVLILPGQQTDALLQKKPKPQAPEELTVVAEKPEQPKKAIEPKAQQLEEKRELVARVRKREKLKGLLRGFVELKEADVLELLSELELSLLEADVSQKTAEEFVQRIKQELLSKKIPKTVDLQEFLRGEIKKILFELTQTDEIDFLSLVKDSKKPFKVLFLGPNGAGKTTTIAKLTKLLKDNGFSSIWAASDTFRAASIEQLEEHAKRLNVRVIKHKYGSDPAAVAFDAVKAAENSNIDVVMIDTAGRQETNRNLIEELKKIERVIKPDLKLFVGEAFAGRNLVKQAREFDSALSVDAFILTKIDTDPKGGTTLSILYELKKPILFLGIGQNYSDIVPFSQEFIIERIV